jgi:hypothetical protein
MSLPPLPPQRVLDRHLPTGVALYGYNADDLRAYAAASVAAERERCAKLCLSRSANGNYRADTREDCAALIRGECD